MILISTQNIVVKLRYYFNNNGQHYFQRSIPRALQRFYSSKRIVRHKLPTMHTQMLVEIDRLARHYDQHFKALKSGEGGTPSQIQEQAVALLASHGVLPGAGTTPARVPEGMYEYPHLDYIEDYLRDKKLAGTMNKIDELAEQLLTRSMPILLSQALGIYFENHQHGLSDKFKKGTLKRWKNIYSVTNGDIPLADVTRDMARRYVKLRLASVKTATIERELKTIRAVINSVIKEKSLKIGNEFERLTIPKKGKDSIARKPFTLVEYRQLIASCIAKGDEIRVLILICCLTGVRPAEAAGLRREDMYLDDEYPHFDLVEYGDRTLKTKNSVRKVPLIPTVAKVLEQYLETHTDGVLFPRYCDGNEVLGDNVSGATSRYIKSLNIKKTLYSARHTVKTLLDQAGTPEYLSESIGGWGKASISRGYGDGHSLANKYEALNKALAAVIPDE